MGFHGKEQSSRLQRISSYQPQQTPENTGMALHKLVLNYGVYHLGVFSWNHGTIILHPHELVIVCRKGKARYEV